MPLYYPINLINHNHQSTNNSSISPQIIEVASPLRPFFSLGYVNGVFLANPRAKTSSNGFIMSIIHEEN